MSLRSRLARQEQSTKYTPAQKAASRRVALSLRAGRDQEKAARQERKGRR